jgi:hypothetical protein
MPTASPLNLLVADSDSDSMFGDGSASSTDAAVDTRLQLSVGADNPFFDFRRPGDPGGVGYYKLHSQFLLVDAPSSGVSVGLEAVTPAGLEADGISQGPTILSPNFGWFYEVAQGTAIQGFVGKNLRTRPGWSDALERDVQYGVALHSPFPGSERDSAAVHFFLEALGRYRFDGDPSVRTTGTWKLVPGIHCQITDSWWLSGGLLMPLVSPRMDSRLWQLTCSWHF